MIITTDNRLRTDLSSITMSGESDAFPLSNCYSNALVEKTLYTDTVSVILNSSTGIDFFALYSSDATSVTITPMVDSPVVLSTSYNGWFFYDGYKCKYTVFNTACRIR